MTFNFAEQTSKALVASSFESLEGPMRNLTRLAALALLLLGGCGTSTSTAVRAAEPQTGAQADETIRAGLRQEEETTRDQTLLSAPVHPDLAVDRVTLGLPKSVDPIRIVMYFDLACPYSHRAYPLMLQLLQRYPQDVQLILKHLPLEMHENAEPAARFLQAVNFLYPDKARAVLDAMLAEDSPLVESMESLFGGNESSEGETIVSFFERISKDHELDFETIRARSSEDDISQIIQKDSEEAREIGLSGTPGFAFNSVLVEGLGDSGNYEKIVLRLLASRDNVNTSQAGPETGQ